ncbi:MAG: phenylalanine--tRNA ligase subunit beta [Verrucomicrobia bacterium]|nr:phenylalanine--tRNA ligase subunit beta [Verrucomicrobiota bacterium]
MKITYHWLKEYVDFRWPPEELAERLTMLGLEVEGVEKRGGEFEGIVVAQVLTRDKHPNADKLSLCRVNDGAGQRQIVCGAQNFKAGDKVPLILPGATLPARPGEAPFTIKVGRIRGVESHGMLCSPRELGLSEDAQGLLVLREDARVGQPFAEYLGRAGGDVLFDLEITPNRPDLNSLVGIAREIAALTGNPLKLPRLLIPPAAMRLPPIGDLVAVRVEDADLCPRYTARLVRGVTIGPSPDWLRARLEGIGLRSINNVVDVTNYVMMEIGQPLHAFDCARIAPATDGKPTVVVRRARDGERFVTLDGQEHVLSGDMLLIADERQGIAVAGVMGGQNSEIHDRTADVLIESAHFHPPSIRRTSKRLGLRTDASYRFERGSDIGITDWAGLRCAQLILETAGGQLAEGVVDAFPHPPPPREIVLRHARANAVLGVDIPDATQVELLQHLGLEVFPDPPDPSGGGAGMPGATRFRVPTFRVDLKREVDLIEEVERLYGLEKVPATFPRGAVGFNAFDAVHDQIAEARRLLAGLGLNEAQGQTLVSETAARLWGRAEPVRLANPLSADMSALRSSLLPGLLDTLRHNLTRQQEDVAVFELGRVFSPSEGSPREGWRLAIALTGRRHAPFWSGADRDARCDIYDMKGVLEEFFEHYGARGVGFVRETESPATLVESAVLRWGKTDLGWLGQLAPALARQHDLRAPVFLAELDFDLLLSRRNTARVSKLLPAFPAVRRDVAMFLPEAVTHEAVLRVVREARPANLETVALFDVFRGGNVPQGRKSVAYAFTYRHAERTLTDAEVNAAHEALVAVIGQTLGATVREG